MLNDIQTPGRENMTVFIQVFYAFLKHTHGMNMSKYSLLKVPFFDIKSSVHKFLILCDSFHYLSICNPHLLLRGTELQCSLGLSL